MNLLTLGLLGVLFQIGHFGEHAFQFLVWAANWTSICGRDMPWMSPWVTVGVQAFGAWAWPTATGPRQMMLGMEVLHLIGNGIFLASIACLYLVKPNEWFKWALYIEGFHLLEHIALTATALWVGKPIGMSTLFGYSKAWFGSDQAVGIRVTWHFAMNLLPLPFVMIGISQSIAKRLDNRCGCGTM